jgi:hypothetical protein
MKKYNLNLTQQESILLQLRIALPTHNFSDLERAYYVYKSQLTWEINNKDIAGYDSSDEESYLNYWVKSKYAPNVNSARAIEVRLVEKGLIEEYTDIPVINKKKHKGLPPHIFKQLQEGNLEILLKMNVTSETK